jgi:glucosamine--fructose-6-phosphate aminotransferase (isomerizing)
VEASVASEFRYSDPLVDAETLVILISQSGETADTLAAMREAKAKGAATLAIVNVVGSTLAREADAVLYTQAGPEIGVASTKAYLAQLVALSLLALYLAQDHGLPDADRIRYVEALRALPDHVEKLIEGRPGLQVLAKELADHNCFFFLGRGYDFAAAMEAALKLKEISYIHAEAYAAGEMKHGPLALVEPGVAVVGLCTQLATNEKMVSNLKEVKAREGTVIALVRKGDHIPDCADSVIQIPRTEDAFAPVLALVPLQLLAYFVARERGCPIDQPRNLAKSVTVE